MGAPSRGFGPRRAAYGEVLVEAPGVVVRHRGQGRRVQGMGHWVDVECELTVLSWLVRKSETF